MRRNRWFEEDELVALADFWRVYETSYEDMQRLLMAPLVKHATFGPLIAAIPEEQQKAQNVASRRLLADSVARNEWGDYEQQLRSQGVVYGSLGVTFSDWYDVIRLVAGYLLPELEKAYGTDVPRLVRAIHAMQEFLDRAMAVLGDSYIATKEAAVRASEERLAITLHSIGDAVISTDQKGCVERINPAAEALTGWSASDCLGKPLSKIFVIENEETGRPVVNPVDRVLREGVVVGLANHTVLVSRDGSRRPIADSAAPIRTTAGEISGVVLVFRDMSAERAAEIKREEAATSIRRSDEQRVRAAELELESRRLEEASRLKSEFLANMSHELRTPLNAIIGFSELLQDGRAGPVEAKQQEFLADILSSGRHLLQLINDVLDLSKVEAGKLDFHPEEIDMTLLVGEVASVLRSAVAASQIHLETHISPDLGTLWLDASRLKQVLYNYLSNALKFTPSGGRVVVRVEPETDAHFRLSVEDTGVGIAAEDIDRLFVEFQQLEAGAGKSHGGTGLGLALTKRLVEAQGGSVGITSELRKGSRFHAVLPRQSVDPVQRLRQASATRKTDAPTILVVEDNPADQERIAAILRGAGYQVETASAGAEALSMVRTRRYAAITLDILLPDMSGVDVLKAIRSGERTRDTPVVVITVVTQHVAVGFHLSDVLAKPLDAAELLEAIRRIGVKRETTGLVVVVDDDVGSLNLMRATLESLGYCAACYTDGERALASLDDERPLAIVLDLVMPGLDGFAFLSRLRARPAHRGLPVFVWTMKDLAPEELRRLRASAEAVVQKGDGGTDLVVAIRNCLGPISNAEE